MPEDSKKTAHKGKHDAKEQRKPRQSRQYATEKAEKRIEKKTEIATPSKPVYEEPGPEFYKNLKRETDDILKITEEANSKYKKKEIQSNWTKYEMPIESYEEMVEQENLGADYEKLVQAPLSVGGHFQFKHEKNWDMDGGPSLYDKYFEIDMETLATAINTVPFYERNNIDLSVFTKSDILTMNNRAIKYKKKYYNDKSYTTPDLEASENILRQKYSVSEENVETETSKKKTTLSESDYGNLETTNARDISDLIEDINLGSKNIETKIENPNLQHQVVAKLRKKSEKETICKDEAKLEESGTVKVKNEEIDDIDELLLGSSKATVKPNVQETKKVEITSLKAESSKGTDPGENPPTENKPVIERPEDLEKWLDDFLG
ncbi:uncharacterized protein LOC126373160 isoform X2 [Pectinophora gossypiella]|uniref:uncharacterized protein LOC126373160 isoform X2 n=1 Tax=Pectinophora gossypiella TaxID=13191 RepID=UPI00214F561A|nr:uncharacterized protein LOC126373160 isoform X2 [Pectinophora gossypiella]